MTAIPDWSGTLSLDAPIVGNLRCSQTGWRMAVTGTADQSAAKPSAIRLIYLTGFFDPVTMPGVEPQPWSDDNDLFVHFQMHDRARAWNGTIKSEDGKVWHGIIADPGAGRIGIAGKLINGAPALRAKVRMGCPSAAVEVAA